MTLVRAAAAGYCSLVVAVVVAPAVVLRSAAERGGAGTVPTTDLLLISAAGGVVGAVLAWRALSPAHLGRPPGTDDWIAALCALGVLATGATLVPAAALHVVAGMSGGGAVPAPVIWAAGLLMACGAASAVGRRSFRWLARGREPEASEPSRRLSGTSS